MSDDQERSNDAPQIVIVDDMREFDGLDGAVYLRTLGEAFDWWEGYRVNPWPVELWLDHDLGGSDDDPEDVRPLVRLIEAHLYDANPTLLSIRILTDNPAGRTWLRQAFSPYVRVIEDVPRWRIANRESE